MADPHVLGRVVDLSRVDANIDMAIHAVRDAITGHVAVHAAPERGEVTGPLYDRLAQINSDLMAASTEVNRLINEAIGARA